MKKPTKKRTTEDNLIAAFAALQPMPVIQFEYRVYYEPITRECTIKTIEQPNGPFVTVTREQYDAIEFCPNYFVDNQNEVVKKPVDFIPKKPLSLNNGGEFRTIKDNNIFRVDDAYLDDTDCWTIRTFDGY
jgi:hypothetical protein